jgi:flagellin
VERLSSGLRINSAKDDAAGMAVRELMRAEVAVLQQGSRNAHDGISMLQTMEGAMAVIDDNLIRMKELAEQAATESYSAAQRTIMNAEFAEMASEIERIADATTFNGIAMLNSNTGTVAIHVGTTDTISISNVDMTKSGLGIDTGTAGWSTTSLLANGEAATDDTWLTVSDTDSVGATLAIQFGTEAALSTVLADTAGTGAINFSLEEVRDAINAVSLNLAVAGDGTVQAYSAAEIIRDDSGSYQLKLNARSADTTSLTTLSSTGAILTGGLTATDAAVNLTSDTTNFTTAVGDAGSGISIDTAANAVSALASLTTAINTKDSGRATFGYKMNRLESTISILDIQGENLRSAESRISDVDVATEMAALTRTQVLSQAGISMLSQANSMPQMALSLLR